MQYSWRQAGYLRLELGRKVLDEWLLTTDNAYNPMPSPGGKHVAYVRVGWGESDVVSMGRSSLVSEIKIIDEQGGATSSAKSQLLAKPYFLSGWTPDSTRLICFRDWNYAVVSMAGEQVETVTWGMVRGRRSE